MSSMGQSQTMPASQSTVTSGGQLIHSGSELAAAGVTSPGVAGAPATNGGSGKDFFSDLAKYALEHGSPTPVSPVTTNPVTVAQQPGAQAIPRMSRSFTLTPHQRNVLGSSFGNDETQMRDYLLKSIGSGDTSLGPYTSEQTKAYRMQASARNVQGAKAQASSFKSIISKALEGYKVS